MRLPRVQYTVRRLMLVVGGFALGSGLLRAIEGYYLEAVEVVFMVLYLVGVSVAVMLGPVMILAILHARTRKGKSGASGHFLERTK